MTQHTTYRSSLLTMVLVASLSACGGGGGGGSGSGNSVGPPQDQNPPPVSGDRIITGSATKGPMDSSNISLIPINALGQITGPAILTTTTNANGNFTANIPAGTGALLVRAGGGSYVDEADQEPDPQLKRRIFLANDEGLESLLPAGVSTVTVSVVTQALLDKTRRETQGATFLQRFAANRTIATNAFGFDVITTMPANPITPAATATVARRQYAMVLGGLANLINRVSIDAGMAAPTIEVILSVSDDLSDGRIDGLIAGAPVMVQCDSITAYSLNSEIARFRNNNFDVYANTPLIAVNESVLSQMSVINQAPVAVNDTYSLNQGTVLTVNAPGILQNDSDPENSPLTAVLVSGPGAGTPVVGFILNPNGSFVYPHNGNNQTQDSFTYRVTDGVNQSNVATVTLTITPGNTPPVATNDGYSVAVGGTINIDPPGVLINDTDAEGSALTATLVAGPTQASAFSLATDGSFNYMHDGVAAGTDSFTYLAGDGVDQSNIATVTLTIIPANTAPVANNDAYNVVVGGTITIPQPGVLTNDTDAEGTALTTILVAGPTQASAFNLGTDGSFNYMHDGAAAGTDSFTYLASDGVNQSNVATVTLTIAPTITYNVNRAVAASGSVSGSITTSGVIGPLSGADILSFDLTINDGTDVQTWDSSTGTVSVNGNPQFLTATATDIVLDFDFLDAATAVNFSLIGGACCPPDLQLGWSFGGAPNGIEQITHFDNVVAPAIQHFLQNTPFAGQVSIAQVPPQPIILTLNGVVKDDPVPFADVTVTVDSTASGGGTTEFFATAAADGSYSVTIESLNPNDFISLVATGVGNLDYVRFRSLAGSMQRLAAAAGADGIVDSTELSAVDITHLSTVSAVMSEEFNVEPIITDDDLAQATARVDSSTLIQVAAALKAVIDNDQIEVGLLESATDTIGLIDSPESRAYLVELLQVNNPVELELALEQTGAVRVPYNTADIPDALYVTVHGNLAFGGLGGQAFFSPGGSGTVAIFDGTTDMTWAIDANGDIIVDFVAPFVSEEFVDFNGSQVQQITTFDRFTLQRFVDNPVADHVFALGHDVVTYPQNPEIPTEEITEIPGLDTANLVVSGSDIIPFSAAALLNQGLTALFYHQDNTAVGGTDPELGFDTLDFNVAGTGTSRRRQFAFSWSIDAVGRLNVQFSNGDVNQFTGVTVEDEGVLNLLLFASPAAAATGDFAQRSFAVTRDESLAFNLQTLENRRFRSVAVTNATIFPPPLAVFDFEFFPGSEACRAPGSGAFTWSWLLTDGRVEISRTLISDGSLFAYRTWEPLRLVDNRYWVIETLDFADPPSDPNITPGRAGTYSLEQILEGNSRPTAVDDSFMTNVGTPINILFRDLIANDFDPEGDQIILINNDPGSAEGGTITPILNQQSATIGFSYTPPAGFTGSDSFTYSVSDLFCGDPAAVTATVTIAVGGPLSDPSWTQVGRMHNDGGMFDGNCNLISTCSFGTMTASPTDQVEDFWLPFPFEANDILFITADGDTWGIASYAEVEAILLAVGGVFPVNLTWSDAGRAGVSVGPLGGNILMRTSTEDPWVTLEGAHCNAGCSEILWGENNFSGSHTTLSQAHGGINVYIRPFFNRSIANDERREVKTAQKVNPDHVAAWPVKYPNSVRSERQYEP